MLAGFASQSGPAGRILARIVAGDFVLVVSPAIEDEYRDIATRRSVGALFARHNVGVPEYLSLLSDLAARSERVEPIGHAPKCRDPDDRKYLHCAEFGRVDFLVSRDRDLLDIAGSLPGVETISPTDLVHRLAASGELSP